MTILIGRWRMNVSVTSQCQTQVIEYNQNIPQADKPIRLQYSNQIELLSITYHHEIANRYIVTVNMPVTIKTKGFSFTRHQSP